MAPLNEGIPLAENDIIARIDSIIATSLGIQPSRVQVDLAFQSIPEWDSISHVNMMIAIETALDTEIDAEQIVELGTVDAIRRFAIQCSLDPK